MDHKMSKDLPITFEEQLRQDCPALFGLNEAGVMRPDDRMSRNFQGSRMRPEFEVGNDPSDGPANALLNPSPAPQVPTPPRSPQMSMRARQMGGNPGLGRRMGERDAAKNLRQQIAVELENMGLDELNQIAKQVRYLKLSQHGKSNTAQQQRSAVGVPRPEF